MAQIDLRDVCKTLSESSGIWGGGRRSTVAIRDLPLRCPTANDGCAGAERLRQDNPAEAHRRATTNLTRETCFSMTRI